jgi:hypothetical protein
MSADKNPRWETGSEPKRRRIDKTAQTEAIAGPSSASQSNDRQSVIDIACDDHPAWRVKVEPPVEDENDKLMEEGGNIDQLRDENISTVSTGTNNHGRPSLGHVSPFLGPGLTNAHSPSRPSTRTSLTMNASHLQYVYHELNDNLVCMFCM